MLDSLMDELNTALTAVSEAERSLNLTHGATSLKRSRASAALDSETINPPIEDDAIKRSRTQYLPVFSRNPMNPYLAAGDAVPTLRQLLAIDTRAAYASGTLLESDILGEMKTNAGMLRDRINVDIPELSPKALEPAVFSASSDGKKTTANVLDRAMFSFDILGSEARTEDVYADLVRREVETTVVGDEDFDSSLSDILHDTGATFSQGSASLFGGCLAQKVQCAKCQDAKVLRKRLEEQIKTLQDQLATKQQKAQEVFQLSGENYSLDMKLRRSEREKLEAIVERDKTIATLGRQLRSTEATKNTLLKQCHVLNRELVAVAPLDYDFRRRFTGPDPARAP